MHSIARLNAADANPARPQTLGEVKRPASLPPNPAQRVGRLAASIVAVSAALLLGGCATLTATRLDVTTPKPAPLALVGASVQVQAAPADVAGADATLFQTAVVQALAHAGMKPLIDQPAPGQAALYTARYSFQSYVDFEASFPSAWPPPGAPIQLPNGAWIYNGYPPIWSGFSWPPPWYERVFELDIRNTATGLLVYRTSAVAGSYDQRLRPVAQKLADSALAGFPQQSGSHRVTLPGP